MVMQNDRGASFALGFVPVCGPFTTANLPLSYRSYWSYWSCNSAESRL